MLNNNQSQKDSSEKNTTSQSVFGRIVREPLFLFLIIGSAIYIIYGLFGQKQSDYTENESTIFISQGEIGWLEDSWIKRWNRPPTEVERKTIVDQYVEETAMYRTALKMGLDRDDVIIRRRLGQKLRFLQEDLVKPKPPAEDELKVYFQDNVEKYTSPDMITVTQIFLDPDKRGDQTLIDAESLLNKLRKLNINTINAGIYGDQFMLQNYYPQLTEADLAKLFGSEFAKSVAELETNKWHGPVLSGYGTHLVYVDERIAAHPPVFDEVKDIVLEDWESDKRQEINELFVEGVLSRYDVIFEGDQSSGKSNVEGEKEAI